ncbi:MAG: hypothetical protein DRJ03_00975 [Chloroflexi bacterium]|nr:MAG: hypothetical protein DRJ03_00975 [Chloroflexota bacterium]
MKPLSTFDIVKILGCQRQRFVHWMRGGFLPSGQLEQRGQVHVTKFDLEDTYRIYLFSKLITGVGKNDNRGFGITRNIASQMVKDLFDNGKTVFHVYETNSLALFINHKRIRQETHQKLFENGFINKTELNKLNRKLKNESNTRVAKR